MIAFQTGLTFTGQDADDGAGGILDGDNPIIGYRNIVTAGNLVASSADPNYPVTNLANPQTNSRWKPASALVSAVEVTTGSADPVDYLAIARHNLGSLGRTLQVSINTGSGYVTAIGPILLGNDDPVLFRLIPQPMTSIALSIGAGDVSAFVGVMHVGRLLVLPRRIYVGHTPIIYGRDVDVENDRSEEGDFLGRIVTGEARSSGFAIANMMPAWYREFLDPFVISCKTRPFFFGWRPVSYPHEMGFTWTTNNPRPKNTKNNGMMGIDFSIGGIA